MGYFWKWKTLRLNLLDCAESERINRIEKIPKNQSVDSLVGYEKAFDE